MTRRHLTLREATVKTTLNDAPITERPRAPRSQISSAERLAAHALTNEEVAAGLRDIGAKLAHERGIIVICLNDPRLTQSQAERARRLMCELYPMGGK